MPLSQTQANLRIRVRRLATFSIVYNSVEALISIISGVQARSIGLIGFGFDSIIEMGSALIIYWQFRFEMPFEREKKALRLIAYSFFILATYIALESTRALATDRKSGHTTLGISIAILSLLVMPVLSTAQRQAGRTLGSRAAIADSKQTLLCTYLSAVLLVGLVLNSTLGWWWADPIVGFFIAFLAIREGREAWRGDNCCS